MKHAILMTLMSLGFSLSLFSQIQTGRIVGTVYDPNKAVVPGAIRLTDTGNVTRISPAFVNRTTISGVRVRHVSYFLDGTDTSEQHQGGSWIQTSVDALQEFSVQQNAYSAEQSRSGSFFNATTKSGTNRVRGTLYEFLRNEKLDARNFFNTKRDLLKRNQFGA